MCVCGSPVFVVAPADQWNPNLSFISVVVLCID